MSNNIRLVVGGFECTQWDDVSIDSDLEIPADAWSVTLFNPPTDPLPSTVQKGALVEIFIGTQQVLKGTVDRITDRVTRQGYMLSVAGRDVVGVLLDNSVLLLVQQQVTLQDLVGQYVFNDFGQIFTGIKIDQGIDYTSAKTAIEPSESVWAALVKLAESIGQYVWSDAAGIVRIGNPFNKPQPPAPVLKLMRGDSSNNVLSVDYSEDITQQYSEVIVLGQDNQSQVSFYATDSTPVDDTYHGQDLTPSKKDKPDEAEFSGQAGQSLPYLRRHIVLDTLADNDDQAAKRAQKLMLDGNLSAYTLTVDVAGWTCNTGHVWDTGWTVKYQSDVTRSAANGEWVIMARTLTLGRNGKQTQLKLKRKQYWMQPVAPLPPSDDEIQYPTEYDDDMAQ